MREILKYIILLLVGTCLHLTEINAQLFSSDLQDEIITNIDTMKQANLAFKYLALGDSYTIGESVLESERFPNQLCQLLEKKGNKIEELKIIAVTGWRTDELINAISEEDPHSEYDLVTLLIGVNNEYQNKDIDQYKREFQELLETATRHAGGDIDKVVVVSIPDYAFTPFGQSKDPEKITRELKIYNKLNKEYAEAMGIEHVYITDLSEGGLEKPELVAEDGLHPSGKMYKLWADRIFESHFDHK